MGTFTQPSCVSNTGNSKSRPRFHPRGLVHNQTVVALQGDGDTIREVSTEEGLLIHLGRARKASWRR